MARLVRIVILFTYIVAEIISIVYDLKKTYKIPKLFVCFCIISATIYVNKVYITTRTLYTKQSM